ncbi:hypothetical protein [Streptomyces sp. NPDC088847]|uniref:hypothetical protein n=1 Tax=Streptomyces sp. NPDC088847 TaxID=3365909 RepID=UPI0037FD3DEB
MKTATNIPQSATTPTGRLPFLVQGSEDADRPVDPGFAAEFPLVAARLAGEHAEQLLTTAQSTLVLNEGLGGWMTAPIETELRDIDSDPDPEALAELPFLAAQMVVMDHRSQAHGRRTEVWLHYGTATGAVTATKAREVLAAMRSFLPQLEAVVDLAEREAAGDFEGDPEIAAADREAEDRRIRAISAGRG